MATLTTEPKELVGEHASALKNYANRVLVLDEALSVDEEREKDARMSEMFAICTAFKLTPREIVALLLFDSVTPRRGCDCPTCNARRSP